MHMDSIFWHGTPNQSFPAARIAPRDSMFRAAFVSQSPIAAAFYAGPNGLVHGYTVSSDATLLDITSETGDPEMSEAHIALLDGLLQANGVDGISGLVKDYYPNGTASWEGVILVLGQRPELGVRLLKLMGYSGFIRMERASWALGDRGGHMAHNVPAEFAIVPKALEASVAAPHRVLAALDPRILRHVATMGAADVAEAMRSGMLSADLSVPMPGVICGFFEEILKAA